MEWTTLGPAEEELTPVADMAGGNATGDVSCQGYDYYGPHFRTFKETVDVYVVAPLALCGVAGNALSCGVLRRMTGSTTPLLLMALAAADSAYLLTCLVFQTLRMLYLYHPHLGLWWVPYVEAATWPLASVTQTAAVYLVLVVTADRWWAICFPLRAKRTATKTRAALVVLLVLMWSFLFNAPTFKDMEVRYINTTCRYEARASPFFWNTTYQLVYKTILCFIFRTMLPLVIVIVLNVKLIQAIRRARQQEKQLGTSREQQGNNSLNVLISVVVTVFIICTLPDFLYRVLNTIEMYNQDLLPVGWSFFAYFGTITNLMLTINSAINFLIYFMSGQTFRQHMAAMCSTKQEKKKRYSNLNQTCSTKLTPSPTSIKKDSLTQGTDLCVNARLAYSAQVSVLSTSSNGRSFLLGANGNKKSDSIIDI